MKPLLWMGACAAASVGVSASAQAADATAAARNRLNDTGSVLCLHGTRYNDRCAGTGQDGQAGRDVSAPDPADGKAGFSFVKVDANGAALPANAAAWPCVGDKVTGLMWETKTADGGVHDHKRRFTNFGDGREGDASAFADATNAEALCGHSDWRLPTRGELQGLVDYGTQSPGPAIDAAWFPNSEAYSVWTSSRVATNPFAAWYVNFNEGFIANLNGDYAFGSVRLVRTAR